jgi:hypothetical protein
MMRGWWLGLGACVFGAGAAVVAIACDEASSHPFGGRLYEDSRGCLDDGTEIDVVDGTDPGSACDPKCVVTPPDPDSGVLSVYVSTMCPPFPEGYDVSGEDPRCQEAVLAYQENLTCLIDGGIANVPDAGEGGVSHAGCATSTLPLVCLPSPDSDPCPQSRASFTIGTACVDALHVYEETCGAYDTVFVFGTGTATVLYYEGASGNLVAVAKQDTSSSSALSCTAGPNGFVLPECPPLGADLCAAADAGGDAAPE